MPDAEPARFNWPRISIVTPSLNQQPFIEACIQSVIRQSYPELEYVVVDGGSSDGSVDVIKAYADRITSWTSEPDSGQTAALIRGFDRCTGDVFGWLCSDDILEPGTLTAIGALFGSFPEVGMIYGDTAYLFPDGTRVTKKKFGFDYGIMLHAYSMIPQPSCFFRSQLYKSAGGLDATLNYAMDYDLYLRIAQRTQVLYLPRTLSLYRLHEASKTVSQASRFYPEWRRVRRRHLTRIQRIAAPVLRIAYLLKAAVRLHLEGRLPKRFADVWKQLRPL